ncbi:MarR family transcriptional regulator [Microbacterium testaceum]|uniref:MarR family transcriptional regulator n=1 Tax=Microbacterium testaceum TaxID=2033 RepID=UPI001780D86F|nr:MarR family transcriptional regulator [Microbacterium testaceum]
MQYPDAAASVARGTRAMLGLTLRSLGPTLETVTLPQWRVLALVHRVERVRQVDIAEAMDVSAPTVTRMIERLVTKGLLTRATSAQNRRESEITLTTPGRQLVMDALERRMDAVSALLDSLDVEEQQALARAAELITSRLEAEIDPALDL